MTSSSTTPSLTSNTRAIFTIPRAATLATSATSPSTPNAERDARIAHWIQQLLSAMLLAYLVFFILGKIPSITAGYVSTTQYGALACLLLLWLLRRGHTTLAGVGLVLTPVITVYSELLLSSIEPFQVWQAGVIMSIPMAGLIFSNRAALRVLLLNFLGIGITVAYWLLWPPAASNTTFLLIRAVGAVIYMLTTALFSMRTITYLTQAEQAGMRDRRDAETHSAQLAQLLDVARTASGSRQIEPTLAHIGEALRVALHCTHMLAVAQLNEKGFQLVASSDPFLPLRAPCPIDIERDSHLAAMLRSGEPVALRNLNDRSPNARACRDHYIRLKLRAEWNSSGSALFVPLTREGVINGFFALHNPSSVRFTAADIALATAYAGQAAMAMDNTHMRARDTQSAAQAERQRLAREMHDSVSQSLYGIVMASRTLTHPGARGTALADDAARYIQTLSDNALNEMRALIFELRPETLVIHGLCGSLRHQAALLAQRSAAAIVLELGDEEPEITPAAQEALYRIGMEALNNAVKHARAGTITLSLARTRNMVALSVNDDGIGFDPAGDFIGHFGLQSMRERAEQHGGNLIISSQPGLGTLIRAAVQAMEQPV